MAPGIHEMDSPALADMPICSFFMFVVQSIAASEVMPYTYSAFFIVDPDLETKSFWVEINCYSIQSPSKEDYNRLDASLQVLTSSTQSVFGD